MRRLAILALLAGGRLPRRPRVSEPARPPLDRRGRRADTTGSPWSGRPASAPAPSIGHDLGDGAVRFTGLRFTAHVGEATDTIPAARVD